jgi:hypothetical protein
MPFGLLHLSRLWQAVSPGSAAAIFYLRMTRRLARWGYPRSPSQTASEFAASIADPSLREAVLRFNAAYELARFGDSTAAAEHLPALLAQVRRSAARN